MRHLHVGTLLPLALDISIGVVGGDVTTRSLTALTFLSRCILLRRLSLIYAAIFSGWVPVRPLIRESVVL